MCFCLIVPPEIMLDERYKDGILMHAGKTAIVEVPFKSSPQPKVKWHYNNSMLPDSKRTTEETIFGMTALTLSKVKRSDAGNYTLSLENKFGKANISIKVKIIDKPGPPEDVRVKDTTANSANLKWSTPHNEGGSEVIGYVIEKRENNRRAWQNVGNTDERELSVDKLIEGNQYHFRLAAQNVVGVGEYAELGQVVVCKSQYCKFCFYMFFLNKSHFTGKSYYFF